MVLKGEFLEKIPAYPRYINPQSSLNNAKSQYEKKFKMYERRLMLRSLRFNKEIEREKIKNKLRKKKRENQNWSRLKSYMCSFEKSLNKEGWLNYKNHIRFDFSLCMEHQNYLKLLHEQSLLRLCSVQIQCLSSCL